MTPVAVDRGFSFALETTQGRLQLRAAHHPSYGPVFADWSTGPIRRRIAAGRRQLLARAVGLDKRVHSHVLDATAGLGRDGFVLAALGATVTMVERSETVFELLQDAHRRALHDPALADAATRITLVHGDAMVLSDGNWDSALLDPMYPDHGKKALASKELQMLREVAGADHDADGLLAFARDRVRIRVAVKRPLKAPCLAAQEPHHRLAGSQARFDVYLPTRSSH